MLDDQKNTYNKKNKKNDEKFDSIQENLDQETNKLKKKQQNQNQSSTNLLFQNSQQQLNQDQTISDLEYQKSFYFSQETSQQHLLSINNVSNQKLSQYNLFVNSQSIIQESELEDNNNNKYQDKIGESDLIEEGEKIAIQREKQQKQKEYQQKLSQPIKLSKTLVYKIQNIRRQCKKLTVFSSKMTPEKKLEFLLKQNKDEGFKNQNLMKKIIKQLQSMEFFEEFHQRFMENLDLKTMQQVVNQMKFRKHKQGDIIIKEGEPSNNEMYVIINGRIKVVSRSFQNTGRKRRNWEIQQAQDNLKQQQIMQLQQQLKDKEEEILCLVPKSEIGQSQNLIKTQGSQNKKKSQKDLQEQQENIEQLKNLQDEIQDIKIQLQKIQKQDDKHKNKIKIKKLNQRERQLNKVIESLGTEIKELNKGQIFGIEDFVIGNQKLEKILGGSKKDSSINSGLNSQILIQNQNQNQNMQISQQFQNQTHLKFDQQQQIQQQLKSAVKVKNQTSEKQQQPQQLQQQQMGLLSLNLSQLNQDKKFLSKNFDKNVSKNKRQSSCVVSYFVLEAKEFDLESTNPENSESNKKIQNTNPNNLNKQISKDSIISKSGKFIDIQTQKQQKQNYEQQISNQNSQQDLQKFSSKNLGEIVLGDEILEQLDQLELKQNQNNNNYYFQSSNANLSQILKYEYNIQVLSSEASCFLCKAKDILHEFPKDIRVTLLNRYKQKQEKRSKIENIIKQKYIESFQENYGNFYKQKLSIKNKDVWENYTTQMKNKINYLISTKAEQLNFRNEQIDKPSTLEEKIRYDQELNLIKSKIKDSIMMKNLKITDQKIYQNSVEKRQIDINQFEDVVSDPQKLALLEKILENFPIQYEDLEIIKNELIENSLIDIFQRPTRSQNQESKGFKYNRAKIEQQREKIKQADEKNIDPEKPLGMGTGGEEEVKVFKWPIAHSLDSARTLTFNYQNITERELKRQMAYFVDKGVLEKPQEIERNFWGDSRFDMKFLGMKNSVNKIFKKYMKKDNKYFNNLNAEKEKLETLQYLNNISKDEMNTIFFAKFKQPSLGRPSLTFNQIYNKFFQQQKFQITGDIQHSMIKKKQQRSQTAFSSAREKSNYLKNEYQKQYQQSARDETFRVQDLLQGGSYNKNEPFKTEQSQQSFQKMQISQLDLNQNRQSKNFNIEQQQSIIDVNNIKQQQQYIQTGKNPMQQSLSVQKFQNINKTIQNQDKQEVEDSNINYFDKLSTNFESNMDIRGKQFNISKEGNDEDKQDLIEFSQKNNSSEKQCGQSVYMKENYLQTRKSSDLSSDDNMLIDIQQKYTNQNKKYSKQAKSILNSNNNQSQSQNNVQNKIRSNTLSIPDQNQKYKQYANSNSKQKQNQNQNLIQDFIQHKSYNKKLNQVEFINDQRSLNNSGSKIDKFLQHIHIKSHNQSYNGVQQL
ncbi:Cyclic nucleotide-binding protein [Pseudocohnilembus persalinus]|uniref:Cyclic nucleotide-binding protein n=1 Tax=Pseudocohnilembus persalinus TaxID=266149 RepID=A0A0V0QFG7_PSEPJ|nr:Cyclic nucleotide-binding protein [Pseudocohnilembus persalinus]|eukprot:KRX00950.1 Cyclic nucleotide-binding protein [Pseudocohnilembus persalinus]